MKEDVKSGCTFLNRGILCKRGGTRLEIGCTLEGALFKNMEIGVHFLKYFVK